MSTLNLTTTFTPPSECLTDTYRYNANQLLGPMTASCYPQGWTNTSTAFYSPGICPSGYTTACITDKTANTVTETIATCCPPSYACAASGNSLGCHSSIVGGISQLITVVNSDFASISTIETQLIGGYVNAFGVQIRFQATDLEHVTTTASTAAKTSATPDPSPGATTTPPNSTPTNTPPPSSALSSGAKAGIGVGAALAVCIGLVLLWLGWRWAKRRRALPAHATKSGGNGNGAQKYNSVAEMQDNGVSEVPGDDLPREIDGHYIPRTHELEGSQR